MADDILGSIGSVFGIGVGKVEVQLIKTAVRGGETLHGRVLLKLARKTEAKRLVCGLEATQEKSTWVSNGRGGSDRRTEHATLYHAEVELDGKRTYFDEAYDLHLAVPAQPKLEMPQGFLGDVAKFINVVQGAKAPVHWRVFAFLDVPWKANIRGGVDITLA
jgi:hypothetical protein